MLVLFVQHHWLCLNNQLPNGKPWVKGEPKCIGAQHTPNTATGKARRRQDPHAKKGKQLTLSQANQMSLCMCTTMYVYNYVCVQLCMPLCMSLCISLCMSLCIYVCLYVSMNVSMCEHYAMLCHDSDAEHNENMHVPMYVRFSHDLRI